MMSPNSICLENNKNVGREDCSLAYSPDTTGRPGFASTNHLTAYVSFDSAPQFSLQVSSCFSFSIFDEMTLFNKFKLKA